MDSAIQDWGVVWLRPAWVAVVEYREFTASGRLRHPAFKGLLPDQGVDLDWLPLPIRRTQEYD